VKAAAAAYAGSRSVKNHPGDFAALAPSDPHFIPPPRRRISWRKAFAILSGILKRNKGQWTQRTQAIFARLTAGYWAVAGVVQRERQYIEWRRNRTYRLQARWNVRNPHRPGVQAVNRPVAMVESVLRWLKGQPKGPPKPDGTPAPQWAAVAGHVLNACLLPVVQARLELQRGS
jgi:hypothetical protein